MKKINSVFAILAFIIAGAGAFATEMVTTDAVVDPVYLENNQCITATPDNCGGGSNICTTSEGKRVRDLDLVEEEAPCGPEIFNKM